MQSRGVTESESVAPVKAAPGGAAPGWREGGQKKRHRRERERVKLRERERERSYLILSYLIDGEIDKIGKIR